MCRARTTPGSPVICVPFGKGIAGHVAETGATMSIRDAYTCDVFLPDVDRETGFLTKSVLCCAVTDTSGKRVAVLQARAGLHPPALCLLPVLHAHEHPLPDAAVHVWSGRPWLTGPA